MVWHTFNKASSAVSRSPLTEIRSHQLHGVWVGLAASMLCMIGGCTASKPQASAPAPSATASPTTPAVEPSVSPSEPPAVPSASPVSTPSPTSQASIKPDATGNVALADGRVTFALPPGFTQLTAQEIATKFPKTGSPPKYAYGNDRRTVTVAVTFSPAKVAPQQLPELKTALRQAIGKSLPNLQWISDEMTTINNTPWVHFEFINQAIDTKVHNDTYFTSFDGKMMGFNFNSVVAEQDAVRAELRKTRDSIVIR
ncbi:hypothetical protein ACKFKF_33125 [Phormidesmis sp. 146-12]